MACWREFKEMRKKREKRNCSRVICLCHFFGTQARVKSFEMISGRLKLKPFKPYI